MGKYITKNRKEDEKKVVSVRIRRPVFEAFKGASLAAQKYGYSMSLSGVFETALEDAITEFKEISGVDFHEIEKTNLHQEWEKQYEVALKTASAKSHKIDNTKKNKKGRGKGK